MNGIQAFLKGQRNRNFATSAQLTLGQIIDKLEKCGLTHGDDDEPKQVDYDFASAVPTTLDSWRGAYEELALGFKLSGYDNDDEHFAETTAETLLSELKNAVGKQYEGWKGGIFTMTRETPVWVTNAGNSGNTGIIDVVDDGWRIILMTAYCEY